MRNFIIQKNSYKKNDNEPDYRLVAKDGDEFISCGAGWKKTDKNGNAYISCSLSRPYGDKPGYNLVSEDQNGGSNASNEQTSGADQDVPF